MCFVQTSGVSVIFYQLRTRPCRFYAKVSLHFSVENARRPTDYGRIVFQKHNPVVRSPRTGRGLYITRLYTGFLRFPHKLS